MEDNLETKDKISDILKNNKLKLITLSSIILIVICGVLILGTINKNKNELISEKYIQAGLYFSSGKKDEAKKIYEEIIYSKNKFYSALALNIILEKELEDDENKILEFFSILEKINISEDQKNLILFKKALFLMNISKKKEANKIFKEIIESGSPLKPLAQEIIKE